MHKKKTLFSVADNAKYVKRKEYHMKRSTPNLRSIPEIKQKDTYKYGGYVKRPSKVNPVFTRKPYENVKNG